MTEFEEERLAALLRLLPPAPHGWDEAAQELPRVRPAIDTIVERAEADAAFRAGLVANLEATLEEAGIEATPSVLASIRMRLGVD